MDRAVEGGRRLRREGDSLAAAVGVGELVGGVRRDVVVDEEASGSSCVIWGGLLLRRASATVSGGDLAIGGLRWLIERGKVARRGCEMRGS